LVQLFAGGDEVAVADLELVGFAPIACLADVGCVAYGAGFEARVFMGQQLEPKLNDAALAAGLRLDRDAFQRDLATTWRRIKGKPTPINKKAMQRSDFSGELTPEQVAYAASDAIMAFQVWEACRAEARSRPYTVARDAIPAVASMEMAGLGYDRLAHVAIMGEWNRLAENEARRFNELTGLWPKEQKKFREHLQSSVDPDLLESWPRADKGGLSLSGKTLEHKPQAKLPEVAQYLRAQALGTLITTFGPRMAARVSPITRRLHFGFTLCGARTGRMTSSPNGQNLPAGPYRRIFRAPPGRCLVSLDYSAIELRAAALLAGERSLLDVFKHPPRLPNGERNPSGDPHEALSATLELDPVRNAGLRLAKALNFRLLFGTGVEGFAENANISIEEAAELVDRWRRVRSSMVQWQNGAKAAAKRQKYATTPLGRRVNCYDVDPDTRNLRFKPNRALNAPIQGGCAEALMVALPLAHDGLRGSGLSAELVAAVHDEIVFECVEADVEPATAIVQQAMISGLEKVFGARPRFQDIALYAVGAPKIGQTWDGEAFDLASLSENETMVLLKGLADVDEGGEDEEGDDSAEPADRGDDRFSTFDSLGGKPGGGETT
jgi:DNA polymerase I-like protein with 3'-5' exonuclease and polymerase domains